MHLPTTVRGNSGKQKNSDGPGICYVGADVALPRSKGGRHGGELHRRLLEYERGRVRD